MIKIIDNYIDNMKPHKNNDNSHNQKLLIVWDSINHLRSALSSENDKTSFDRAIDLLSGSNSKFLTGIVLSKMTNTIQRPAKMNQLNISSMSHFTHKKAKPTDYDVILHNRKAIQQLYPVVNNDDNPTYAFKEDDYFYYNILRNSASCYVVYLYTYENSFLRPSKYKK